MQAGTGADVVGIDAGGSKTVCLVADRTGAIVADARGPGANLQSAGELDVEKTLHDLLSQALAARPGMPAALCLGMAGVDRPGDAHVIRGILARLCRGTKVLIVNDALVALEAGAPGAPGIVLIAGTGSIAYGRDATGHAARAGGWGYVLGDEGSGFWLGRQAVRAILRAADRRGPDTALAPAVLAHFGLSRPQELVQPIYEGGMRPKVVAALASIVGDAADAGDPVAARLVDLGAEELAGAAISVARRLRLDAAAIDIPLAGGVFAAVPRVRHAVIGRLQSALPLARPALLTAEPALGALRLATALASGDARVPVYLETTH